MKKSLFIVVLFAIFATNMYAANDTPDNGKKTDTFEKAAKEINNCEYFMNKGFYYSAYTAAENAYALVENEQQTNKLLELMKELKKLSPQKPQSECDCLKVKLSKKEKVSEEDLFFYGCKDIYESKEARYFYGLE